MNTSKDLINEFCENSKNYSKAEYRNYNILKGELIEIDVRLVLAFLLKYNFTIEIGVNKYDISFGYNKENGEIGFCSTNYPGSEWLTSYELIDKSFKEGKWFYLNKKKLSKREIYSAEREIYFREYRENLKGRIEWTDRIFSNIVEKKLFKEEWLKDKKFLNRLRNNVISSEKNFKEFISVILGGNKNND